MQLYNDSLLMSHIKACQGELIDCYQLKGYSGYQIVYATEDVTIPDGFEWPEGYVDLPACGVTCRTGQPICSIITHQKQASSVMNELQIKQLNLLKGFNTHGI
jgi:methenyltetrahydromethanopterin cyclohydrolase